LVIRVLLVLACSISGSAIAYYTATPNSSYLIAQSIIGLIIGLFVAVLVIRLEKDLRKISLRIITGGVVGMIVGLLIALILGFGLNMVSKIRENQQIIPWIYLLLTGILGYLGLVLGSKKIEEFNKLTGIDTKDVNIIDAVIYDVTYLYLLILDIIGNKELLTVLRVSFCARLEGYASYMRSP